MQLPGSSDMQRLKALMTSLGWWRLMPAQEALETQPGSRQPAHFIAAARADGILVAYLPVGGSVSFRREALSGLRRARWFNPRTAAWAVADSAASTFQAPDDKDWVLVVDRETK